MDFISLQFVLVVTESVLLVYPPCLHFTVAFLACCRAGLVAVPVFPPHPHRRDSLHMFAGIVATCGAQVALTDTSYNYQKKLSSIQDALVTKLHQRPVAAWPEQLTWIVTDTIASQRKPPPSPSGSSSSIPFSPTTLPTDSLGEKVAFLQFTSGSTSDPKGVMITHGNLAHNLHCIVTELKASDDTIVVSWLPQYHDMGLIGSVLGCLYCGGTGYYLSPLAFLQRPALWIETVARYRATHLQTPNFALKLVARKWNTAPASTTHSSTGKQQGPTTGDARLDLSSVRHVINAAEPVDVQSMRVFYDTFVPLGLRRGVVYPTYGLAEHTVFVCSGGQQILHVQKHELEVNGKVVVLDTGSSEQRNSVDENEDYVSSSLSTLVGCGFPKSQGIAVVIVNTETRTVVDEDVVGEIWVNSPSKAAGYYGKPKESLEDFHAALSISPNDEEGYLRTGDLGFLHNDELFICGRLKDLIIIGGRNYYPQDIEATAEASSDKVRLGCSAAFTIDPTHQGGEEVAIVMELKEVPPTKDIESVCLALANHVRAAVNQEHSLGISSIAFLKTRTVPKTSSGKIARAWCRKGYLAGTLQEVYRKDFKVDSSRPQTDQSKGQGQLETKANPPTSMDAPTIRAMTKTDILNKLVADLSRVGGVSVDSIDVKAPLVHMLDSLTISQFKGMLENNYAVKLSDEYLFRESTTTTKLVEVVKLGHAPDDADGAKADAMAVQTGKARGLAGALGCPPGVVCVIM
jgi:acyl-CoA synthetase (AMP-forming)/AMP-acid ligase II